MTVRTYPYPVTGQVERRSPLRFLLWLARLQWSALTRGVVLGSAWMLCQAFVPLFLGKAIDSGISKNSFGELLLYSGLVLGLGAAGAVLSLFRHRIAVSNWLRGSYTATELLGRKIAHTGDALPQKTSTGEMMSAATSDVDRVGQVFDISARFAGAVLSYIVVTILIWQINPLLGVIVLLGVPLCCGAILLVLKPMHKHQAVQRERSGKMTAIGSDTVTGLRVLRGIGGEHIFVGRYKEKSQQTRQAGNSVARSIANMDAIEIFVTGGFSVAFTWVGAVLAQNGTITPGTLISLYAYSVFLLTPIRTFTEYLNAGIRAFVGSRKILHILNTDSAVNDDGTAAAPPAHSPLHDPSSSLTVHPGKLMAVVSADPKVSASLAERFGRFDDAALLESPVTWGGTPLRDIPLARIRERISYSGADPQLFSGTLREVLDPHAARSDADIMQAIADASAFDVLDSAEDGLDAQVDEKGRGFSGGQRQRLALARAFLTDAEVLLLVGPTSAVDAHTEARIASALGTARAGKTTLVTTASPLMLGAMDEVVLLSEGRVAARGTHRELLAIDAYRDVVVRGE